MLKVKIVPAGEYATLTSGSPHLTTKSPTCFSTSSRFSILVLIPMCWIPGSEQYQALHSCLQNAKFGETIHQDTEAVAAAYQTTCHNRWSAYVCVCQPLDHRSSHTLGKHSLYVSACLSIGADQSYSDVGTLLGLGDRYPAGAHCNCHTF